MATFLSFLSYWWFLFGFKRIEFEGFGNGSCKEHLLSPDQGKHGNDGFQIQPESGGLMTNAQELKACK